MKLLKRSLAVLLAMAMAASTVAFAAEGDVTTEEPTIAQEITADSTLLKNYANTALERGYFGDNGYALTEEEAGADAEAVLYAYPSMFNEINEVFWGVEMQRIEPGDYTFVVKFALVDPAGNTDEEDTIITALTPVVRDQDTGEILYDPEDIVYLTLGDLRERTAQAEAAGEQFITMSVPIQMANFTMEPANQIKIECRLSSNKRATELGYGNFMPVNDTGIAIRSIMLQQGATIQDGLDSNGVYYENGIIATNKLVNYNGAKYYTDGNGKFRTNQIYEGYYIGSDGKIVENGTVDIQGKTYFVKNGTKAPQGLQTMYGQTYYVLADGTIAKNQWVGNSYYEANGRLAVNKIIGTKIVNTSGVMVKNAIYTIGSTTYALDAAGNILKGNKRVKVGSYYYYVNTTGAVQKNVVKGSYAYGSNGRQITGTKIAAVKGTKYYISKGKVSKKTGVVKVKKAYYALKKGKVQTGTKLVKLGKKQYAVKAGKVPMKKVVKIKRKIYVNKSQKAGIYKRATFKIGKKRYKADKKGVCKIVKR